MDDIFGYCDSCGNAFELTMIFFVHSKVIINCAHFNKFGHLHRFSNGAVNLDSVTNISFKRATIWWYEDIKTFMKFMNLHIPLFELGGIFKLMLSQSENSYEEPMRKWAFNLKTGLIIFYYFLIFWPFISIINSFALLINWFICFNLNWGVHNVNFKTALWRGRLKSMRLEPPRETSNTAPWISWWYCLKMLKRRSTGSPCRSVTGLTL